MTCIKDAQYMYKITDTSVLLKYKKLQIKI